MGMRQESEVEALLTELTSIDATDEERKRRLDRKRMVGTVAMIALLEWVLGANGVKVRDALVKQAKEELREAIRHADRPSGRR